ncbi:MAG: elongation factor P [Dehalococcoidia bacterium]|nr:elongation factor P [Dehalococcoidia bacterium]HRC63416.1 elongation factor P [Dehalococcoidia bacterium]
MISTGEIKRGVSVEVDGNLYQVVEVQHVKTKKSAVYRVKMRDLRGGHIIERTFNAGEKLAAARVERRDMQFLYSDASGLTFMNTQTFDQIAVPASIAGNALSYLKEGDVVQVLAYGEEALGIELPPAVQLKIVRSDPGVKGDTATGATKPATLETGLVVNVPLFINEGDTIKVGTSEGNYIERVSNA